MNKRVFGIFGLVIAVGVGVLVWKGVIPPKHGLEGSIGVANRYQAEQIASGDVTLDPTVLNDLIQSDVIHRLAKDPEFRKTIRSDAFKSLAVLSEFTRLMNDKNFLSLIQRPDFAKFAISGQLTKVNVVLEAEKAKKVSSDYERSQKAVEAVEYGKSIKTADELDKAAKTADELDKAAKTADKLDKSANVAMELDKASKPTTIDWAKAGLPVEFEAIAKCTELRKLIETNADFAKVIKGGQLAKALVVSPELGKMLTGGELLKVVSTEQGAKALVSPELDRKVREYSGG